MAENTQAVDPVQKPQEIQTGERTGSAEGRQQWPDSALEKRY